jgi:hypothetical protein
MMKADGEPIYTCSHREMVATTGLLSQCDRICNDKTGISNPSLYSRNQVELCHKWAVSNQNAKGVYGRHAANHEVVLCSSRCHRIIDSELGRAAAEQDRIEEAAAAAAAADLRVGCVMWVGAVTAVTAIYLARGAQQLID